MVVNLTLAKQKATPVNQAIAALIIGLICMLIAHVIRVEPGSEYFAAMIGIILFTIINTVVSLNHSSFARYTLPSYYIYIALVALLFISARLLSGISIWNLPIYRMMLTSVTIFFFIISTLVRVIRLIYEVADQEG